MWNSSWREKTWSELDQSWDIIIIGGGITGAGLLRLASSAGYKTLLVEGKDFSSGTSSRSSKLVHGGFRYLYNKQYEVTRESVREREWLLNEAEELVNPLPFLLANYEQYHVKNIELWLGVVIYDLFASKWKHKRYSREKILRDYPKLNPDGLMMGCRYEDANVDDSRLVVRVLREAVREGGTALNYARAIDLLQDNSGKVHGILLKDTSVQNGREIELKCRIVINASGPWTDEVRDHIGAPNRLRKLRGSHLVFPYEKFPMDTALTLFHPKDKRAMFVIPWEGTTLVGTTDIDHPAEFEQQYSEPFATREEVGYLLDAVKMMFPDLRLELDDILSSFSGLRPVVRSGAATPSKESRAHAIWLEKGLLTVTGGKLTTFRIMAEQTMNTAAAYLGRAPLERKRFFNKLPDLPACDELDPQTGVYLLGRYGIEIRNLIETARPGELQKISPLPNVWAELRWAAREEAVHHLDDLLLRRVRLGLLLPEGGTELLPTIRSIVQPELGWCDERWEEEERRYRQIWKMYYAPVPDASC
ncbi:MAG: glycerol-3-phosphate dehydrogenase/oxidase [Chloroflexi bacterium]|nr:MAG: glycerol-3-phosphate dehydrogenase/oxidase [Chloroflexota bacterium]